ncbi:MAG TPA: CBS domain-containing protein [Steroidobacteraceae bacterium]|nr:CBS domain-containing protein [Steroidobacteraceae bacterium]
MNAYDLCQRHVVTVRRHEELSTAAWMMRERNVGCLVVVDTAGTFGGWRPVGLLTDRDIVTNVFARDCDPRGMLVEEVMTRHPLSVSKSTGLDEALQRMRAAGVRRVPVVDDRGCLAGILSIDDVFDHLAQRVTFTATPIRPEARPDIRFEQPCRPAPTQPGNMGIERI